MSDYLPVRDEQVTNCGDDVDRLAQLYVKDAATVARVCDEVLDRSGGLLGRVRNHVRERGWRPGYPALHREGGV